MGSDQENSDLEVGLTSDLNANVEINFQQREVVPGCSGEMSGAVQGAQATQVKKGLDEDDYQKLVQDPMFRRVFDTLYNCRVANEQTVPRQLKMQQIQPPQTQQPQTNAVFHPEIMDGGRLLSRAEEPMANTGRQSDARTVVNSTVINSDKVQNHKRRPNEGVVKSPSDTTLCTPALKKVKDIDAISKISNFIEVVRIETTNDQ